MPSCAPSSRRSRILGARCKNASAGCCTSRTTISSRGSPNRHRLVAELDVEIKRCSDEDARSALFFIDLDQFKYVNDTCGHAAGDHLLHLAAQQIRYGVRPEDFIARFGGDEFVVLVRDVSRNEARAAATKVLELMRGLKHVEQERVFHLQCSIGVALLHGNRMSSHEVIAQADLACQSAKARGRNRVEVYSAAGKQSEQIAKDVATTNLLHNALETDRFELLYQPLMHIKTGVVSHYETLLRLPTEDGVIGPDAFLPAAFRSGVMADIDRWVLKRVVQSLAELPPTMPKLRLSTNLSGFAFEDDGLAAYLRNLLREHGVAGRPARARDHGAARRALRREHGPTDRHDPRPGLPARDRRLRQRL